jgi:hypothetical protein
MRRDGLLLVTALLGTALLASEWDYISFITTSAAASRSAGGGPAMSAQRTDVSAGAAPLIRPATAPLIKPATAPDACCTVALNGSAAALVARAGSLSLRTGLLELLLPLAALVTCERPALEPPGLLAAAGSGPVPDLLRALFSGKAPSAAFASTCEVTHASGLAAAQPADDMRAAVVRLRASALAALAPDMRPREQARTYVGPWGSDPPHAVYVRRSAPEGADLSNAYQLVFGIRDAVRCGACMRACVRALAVVLPLARLLSMLHSHEPAPTLAPLLVACRASSRPRSDGSIASTFGGTNRHPVPHAHAASLSRLARATVSHRVRAHTPPRSAQNVRRLGLCHGLAGTGPALLHFHATGLVGHGAGRRGR